MRFFYSKGYKVRWTQHGSKIPLPYPLPKNPIKLESQSLSVTIFPDTGSWEVYFVDRKGKKEYIYRTNGSDGKLLEVADESGVVYSYVPYPG